MTDAAGKAGIAYPGNDQPGVDEILASFVDAGGTTRTSSSVTKAWTAPVPGAASNTLKLLKNIETIRAHLRRFGN